MLGGASRTRAPYVARLLGRVALSTNDGAGGGFCAWCEPEEEHLSVRDGRDMQGGGRGSCVPMRCDGSYACEDEEVRTMANAGTVYEENYDPHDFGKFESMTNKEGHRYSYH